MTTDSSTGDWTPERIREARERCEAATKGPWREDIAGGRPAFEHEATFADIRFACHAREDLPAALAEIERQARAAIVLTADAAALRSELAAEREEIERLTAELASAADDIETARHAECRWQDRYHELAAHAPADASRPGLTEEQARKGWFLAAAWARLAQARGGAMQAFDEDYETTKNAREWLESIGVDVNADPPVVIPEPLRASRGETCEPSAPPESDEPPMRHVFIARRSDSPIEPVPAPLEAP